MGYKFNNIQTQLPDEFLDSLKPAIKADLIEFIDSIPFITNMTKSDRRHAKDMPLDGEGKIIVDITNPHILENMDYFRQSAIYFQEHGTYTHLYPNKAPNSEYVKFWHEEARRCREGFVREDGEWVTGFYYFYLNYSVIQQIIIREGSKRADRVTDFPKVYDGDYLYMHYLEQARNLGKHVACLKKRGAGFSFKGGSHLARNFIHGESTVANNHIKAFAIANEKEFLIKDGVLNKFLDTIDFLATHTPFPSHRGLKDSMNDMHWKLGYKDPETLIEKGVLNEVMGVTLKNDHEKARGKRGSLILWEEAGKFSSFLTAWQIARPSVEADGYAFGIMVAYGCVCAGTKVFNNKGELINIEDIRKTSGILGYNTYGVVQQDISHFREPYKAECVRITTTAGRTLECSLDHPVVYSHHTLAKRVPGKRSTNEQMKYWKWREAGDLKIGDQLGTIEEVPFFGDLSIWEPRMVGWLIGDGSYGKDKTPVLSNCEEEILSYVKSSFSTTVEKEYLTKTGKTYQEIRIREICSYLRELGIYGQTKDRKTLPPAIHSCTKEDICELLGGFFDTDSYISLPKNKTKPTIVLTAAYKSILDEVILLLQKLGIHGKIRFAKPNPKNPIDRNGCYRLEISDVKSLKKFTENISFFPKEKQNRLELYKELLEEVEGRNSKYIHNLRFEKITNVERIGEQLVYNLTAEGSNTYIANGIVTHNTGGTIGADFAGLQEIFYNPTGYNIHNIPNVFDKNAGESSICSFFFPTYLNSEGFFDHNGNSDVIGALLEKVTKRNFTKYNTSDPHALIQEIAENPITPQDAIMRVEGNRVPITELKEHLSHILPNVDAFTSSHYIGLPIVKADGTIELDMMSGATPIRSFPIKDNKNKEGCIEIFHQPIRRVDGTIPFGRYIAGMDPYDDDESETTSLGSMFILDTVTDRIVAEYTGRPTTAKEYYANCHKILKYYNAICNYENDKKGFFAYMENNNGLYHLAENPQILKSMDMIKPNYFGNKLKGTNSGAKVNAFGRSLYADWLREPSYGAELDEEGNHKIIPNLYQIRSIGLIQESIAWNPEGNFDRISALGMLMILREDRAKLEVSLIENKKGVGEDPFFNKHFNKFKTDRAIVDLNKFKIKGIE